MIRNNTNGKLQTSKLRISETQYNSVDNEFSVRNCLNKNTKKKASIILPPSPKAIYENNSLNQPEEDSNILPLRRIQPANAMFDPNNASPASDFMNLLKLRMSVYYEQDVNMFV